MAIKFISPRTAPMAVGSRFPRFVGSPRNEPATVLTSDSCKETTGGFEVSLVYNYSLIATDCVFNTYGICKLSSSYNPFTYISSFMNNHSFAVFIWLKVIGCPPVKHLTMLLSRPNASISLLSTLYLH